ncbi:MAG: alpha-tubulin suppressor-like RCC1 family protein/carbonic anhydrase [Bacteriovoracaceae bacterium]|jgi:alpha-tubulin suppressor-like RCC1 family protein/carbonic anhydrase/acetyltransferase-like protein (isoleucine patch superfamily)
MKIFKSLGLTAFALGAISVSGSALANQCGGQPGFAHPNGGGFVSITADVAPSVFVDANSIVCGYARVSGNVKIITGGEVVDFAVVEGNVEISEESEVYGNAYVKGFFVPGTGDLKITNGSSVFGNAYIESDSLIDNSNVYGNARILEDSEILNSSVYGNAAIEGADVKDSTAHGLVRVGDGGSLNEGAVACDDITITDMIFEGWEHCADSFVISKLSVGSSSEHMCAIGSTDLGNQVICWGQNEDGQLGIGLGSDFQESIKLRNAVAGIDDATDISTGGSHTCSVRDNDTVECWGSGGIGQLGDGNGSDSTTPVVATGLTGVIKVSSGDEHTCALTSGGSVSCWGANDYGQLGDGTTTERLVPTATGITTAIDISAGEAHTCALLSDNSVQCWGSNSHGQVGAGAIGVDELSPILVSGGVLGTVTSINTGAEYSCAYDDESALFCWGSNTDSQLGRTGGNSTTPTESSFEGEEDAVFANTGAGNCSSYEGIVSCWGNYSTLGVEFETEINLVDPIEPSLKDRSSALIGSTSEAVCTVTTTNEVICWGEGAIATDTEIAQTPVFADYIK